jgi:hypothetical protein
MDPFYIAIGVLVVLLVILICFRDRRNVRPLRISAALKGASHMPLSQIVAGQQCQVVTTVRYTYQPPSILPPTDATYSTSDAGIATVDAAGVVSGVEAGVVTITAQATPPGASQQFEASMVLEVVADVPVGQELFCAGKPTGTRRAKVAQLTYRQCEREALALHTGLQTVSLGGELPAFIWAIQREGPLWETSLEAFPGGREAARAGLRAILDGREYAPDQYPYDGHDYSIVIALDEELAADSE